MLTTAIISGYKFIFIFYSYLNAIGIGPTHIHINARWGGVFILYFLQYKNKKINSKKVIRRVTGYNLQSNFI